MSKIVKTRIVNRHAKEADWNLLKDPPILGEILVYEPKDASSPPLLKIGDGISTPDELRYVAEIPQASSSKLGGIKADPASVDMIQPVSIRQDGHLATFPTIKEVEFLPDPPDYDNPRVIYAVGKKEETTLYYLENKGDLTAPSNIIVNDKTDISKDHNIVTWDATPNAETYNVKIDNNSFETISTTSIDVTTLTLWPNVNDGIHTLYIKASAEGYNDSEVASALIEKITFGILNKLNGQTVSRTHRGYKIEGAVEPYSVSYTCTGTDAGTVEVGSTIAVFKNSISVSDIIPDGVPMDLLVIAEETNNTYTVTYTKGKYSDSDIFVAHTRRYIKRT